MRNQLKPYIRVWLKLTANQFQSQISNARIAAIIFIFGKLFRLATAFLMVYLVVDRAKLINGYNLEQAILILLLFNLVSTLSQLFMRGIYIFRQKVSEGTFDFYLLNPLSELFYSLFSNTDPMDVLLLLPYTGLVVWAWIQTGYPLTITMMLILVSIILIAFLMTVAWHIVILGIGIRYMEVDNTIMLYRDLERLAALPISMYGKWGSVVLTYLLPFGLMATVPANTIFGLMNPAGITLFAVLAIIQLKLALVYWKKSLLTYSSASS
jgi:ABC-2 type transport system permease protein